MDKAQTSDVNTGASHYFEQVGAELDKRDAMANKSRGKRLTSDFAPLRKKTPGIAPYPLKIRGQDFALVNIAHKNQFTKCDVAAFRICGFFESTDQAITHMESESDGEQQRDVNYELHPSHAWKLISEAPLEDTELERLQEIYDNNTEQRKKAREDFDAYCDVKSKEEVDEEEQQGILEEAKKRLDPIQRKAKTQSAPSRVNRNEEVRGQRFAAVGLIFSDEQWDKCSSGSDVIFVPFAAFDEEKEAVRYVTDTLSDKHVDFNIYVVDMYEWVFPDALKTSKGDDIETSYRHETLHALMKHKKEEKDKISAYREQCEAVGMEPRVTNVTGNAEDVLPPALEMTQILDAEDDMQVAMMEQKESMIIEELDDE